MAPQGIIIGALREIIVYTTQKKGAISVKTAHKRREPIDLTQGPCWKVILLFSLPVILSYLLQQVYSISDAAIVGQTLTAAEVAGVNVHATKIRIYILASCMFGLAGCLLAAKSGGASVNTAMGYELDAIAACTIGGVSTTGGVGTVPGVLVGVLVFELMKVALQFMNVNSSYTYIVQGLVIIVAVAIDIRKYLAKK